MSAIQLTPLWEHILRTQQLPDTLNEPRLFKEFLERLKDPEWQVRQHALRVLIDVLIVMSSKADPYMSSLIPQLVENLCHQAPTLRKSALDCLRVYLCETEQEDKVMFDILNKIPQHRDSSEPYSVRLIYGILLSLPALIQCILHSKKSLIIVRKTMDLLIEQMGQVEHQEITLKVLQKMHELLGEAEFMAYMSHGAYREYELLCNVYGLDKDFVIDLSNKDNHLNTWRLMANKTQPQIPLTTCWRSSSDDRSSGEESYPTAKIIMETEIKLNNDTLTMRILEAKDDEDGDAGTGTEAEADGDGDAGLQKTSLTNSSTSNSLEEDDVICRRLSSAKKLSDSMGLIRLLSDSDELTNSTQTLIDLREDKGNEKQFLLPSTPSRTPKRVTFGGEVVKMRTPDSDGNTINNNNRGNDTPIDPAKDNPPLPTAPALTTDLSKTSCLSLIIPHDNTKPINKPTIASPKLIEKPLMKHSPLEKNDHSSPRSMTIKTRPNLSPQDSLISPRTEHKEIEVLHNLQRDPSPNNRTLSAKRSAVLQTEENVSRQDNNNEIISPGLAMSSNSKKLVTKSWEDLNIVDDNTLWNLRSGNWRQRLQGVLQLKESLQSSENLVLVQPCLDSLLRTLVSAECHPEVAEEKRRLLINLITRLPLENLEDRTIQIMTGLCRQGGSGANRVCKVLMQRLPSATIVLKLLSPEFLHTKSSRFREHALQMVIYALMTFPSTCFDMATCVRYATYAALNRKRRVRQAALDVLAVLGQITGARNVLDVVQQQIANSRDEDVDGGAALLAAVKARLSRKQLPLVTTDGAVEYSLHIPTAAPTQLTTVNSYKRQHQHQHQNQQQQQTDNYNLSDVNEGEYNGQYGPDIDWIVTGVGSVSPNSLKRRVYRHRSCSQQAYTCYPPPQSISTLAEEPSIRRFSIRIPTEHIISGGGGGGDVNDDNVNLSVQHTIAPATPYSYGLVHKKCIGDYTNSLAQRSMAKTCSDSSSMDGRSSDSTYTSSGGSTGHQTITNLIRDKSRGNGVSNDDSIAGRFTRQAVNSRFPTMMDNNYLRVYKTPNYYPGMGAYAHLHQQQVHMNSKYPKITYNFNTQQQQQQQKVKQHLQPTQQRRHIYPTQQQQQQSAINSYNNRTQHFNRYTTQQQHQHYYHINQQQQHQQEPTTTKRSQHCCEELSKTIDAMKSGKKDYNSNNCFINENNLNDTYTIRFETPPPPPTTKLTANASNTTTIITTTNTTMGRRFIQMEKHLTQNNKPLQAVNETNSIAEVEVTDLARKGEYIDFETLPERTSIRSATYSQKSTASAQSSEGSQTKDITKLNSKSAEKTDNRPELQEEVGEGEGEGEEEEEEGVTRAGLEALIQTQAQTTGEESLNDEPDSKEVTAENNNQTSPSSNIIDSLTNEVVIEDILELEEANSPQLQRSKSLISIQSRTDSILTQLEENSNNNNGNNTPHISRNQSVKSLYIEELMEESSGDSQPYPNTKKMMENCEAFERKAQDYNVGEGDVRKPGDVRKGNKSSELHSPRIHSPTIAELKAFSRRNSIAKSIESYHDRTSSTKPDVADNTTETSSQSSTQLNSSGTTLPPHIVKPQHTPLKQKSKSSHFLKRQTRKVSPVKQSIKAAEAEMYPPTPQKFDKPREALMKTFDQLDSSNWEVVVEGLKSMVRLVLYHADILDPQMHMICIQLTRSVRNLRSQVARAACQTSADLFALKSRYLEQECDDLVNALLHRTADTNRFLRVDAAHALESMCDYLTPGKILNLLSGKGAHHQNALVRTTTAKLLYRLVERLGSDRIYCMPREQRDKLFLTGANLLLEGSLDTRGYAKSLFKLLSQHASYTRLLVEIIPPRIYRNVEKTLKSIR